MGEPPYGINLAPAVSGPIAVLRAGSKISCRLTATLSCSGNYCREMPVETSITEPTPESQRKSKTLNPRILVVDDEEGIRTTLSRILQLTYEDCRIMTAETAEQALELAGDSQFDILVTDLKLPEMNGLDLMKLLQGNSPRTQSIVMTAYGNDDILAQANDLGCLAYLEKPFDLDELVAHIDRAIAAKSASAERYTIPLDEAIHSHAKKLQSVVLSVMSRESAGIIVVRDGIITHAQYDSYEGPEALIDMLAIPDPTITKVDCQVPVYRTLALTWHTFRSALRANTRESQLRILRGLEPLFAYLPDFDFPKKLRNPTIIEDATTEQRRPRALQRHTIEDDVLLGRRHLDRPPTRPSIHSRLQLIKDATPSSAPATNEDSSDEALTRAALFEDSPDFSDEQLELRPEPEQGPLLRTPSPREQRESRVKNYVNSGIDYFREHKFHLARKAWELALRLDPRCAQAKYNLKILDELELQREKMH